MLVSSDWQCCGCAILSLLFLGLLSKQFYLKECWLGLYFCEFGTVQDMDNLHKVQTQDLSTVCFLHGFSS